eukprot:6205187-Pleurochrysis_carterae.AAC.3
MTPSLFLRPRERGLYHRRACERGLATWRAVVCEQGAVLARLLAGVLHACDVVCGRVPSCVELLGAASRRTWRPRGLRVAHVGGDADDAL